MNALKNILLWRYGRSTLPYDVLCVLILAFIFLTPHSWFERGEPRTTEMHRNRAKTVLLPVPADSSKIRRDDLERQVRTLTNRDDVRIIDERVVRDLTGRITAYEVDIE